MKTKNLITVKGSTKKELIEILGLSSVKVLNRKITHYEKLIGKKVGRYYDCKQVEIMIGLFGAKKELNTDETDSLEKRHSTVERMIERFENKQ